MITKGGYFDKYLPFFDSKTISDLKIKIPPCLEVNSKVYA